MPDSSRLDALELAVARLTRELVALRAEVRAGRERGGAGVGDIAGADVRSTVAPDVSPLAAVPVEDPDSVFAADAAADGTVTGVGEAAVRRGGLRGEPYVSDELRRLAGGGVGAAGAGGAGGGGGASPSSATVGIPRPLRHATPSFLQRDNFEALIGRYGTLALAAFTILMGVGAFIGWAIRNGVIGPELRVALGALLAAVVGTVGWRMRRGTSPRFGGVLLALALAIVHVVCWGAGPLLHLVPDVLALGIAAASSAALAGLALREEDQSLFNVGFGGGLLAPFVTSSDTGDAVLLLLYGAVVLGAGMRATRDRSWGKTPFVLGLGIMAYTAAASGQLAQHDAWARAAAPTIFAIGAAWLALILVPGKPRERLAVTGLLSAVGALAAMHDRDTVTAVRYALAALITTSGFLVATGGQSERIVRLATTLVLPLAGLIAALATANDVTSPTGVMLTLLWAVGSAGAAIANRDGGRNWHAFTATALGGGAIALQLEGGEVPFALAIATYGAVAAAVMRRFSLRGVGLATAGWLAVGAAVAFGELDDRARWITNPFLTPASGAAAAICAAWLVFSWHAARTGAAPGEVVRTLPRTLMRILGAVLTFAWIHVELGQTVSIDVSTFLLVAYYAVSGLVAIGAGRSRAIPILRQLGLALSVLAALKAMAETSSLSIGWRVGGYLLSGAFLLGVAYWYRGTGGARRDGTVDASSQPEPPLESAAS